MHTTVQENMTQPKSQTKVFVPPTPVVQKKTRNRSFR